MYIIKNALRCISRAKGRNILIGIIVLAISVSACIGLSIRQAADNAREDTLEGMNVIATISYDRQSAMSDMMGEMPEGGDFEGGMPDFDKDSFRDMMGSASTLTLEEYEKYAEADSVQDFYYTLTASLNGSENLEPVSTEEDSDTDTDSDSSDMPEGMPGGMQPPEDMGGFDGFMGQAENYITEIDSAMNLTVVLQMLGIAVGLTLVAGIVSMLFVMRYEPLKILANRD